MDKDKENAKGIFRSLSNVKEADEKLRNMDLSSLEKTGILLEYSRESFVKNMNRLIMSYAAPSDSQRPKIDYNTEEKPSVKKLELSENAKRRVEEEIERYKREYQTTEVELNIDGKACKGIKFEGSHRNGSNPGEYYLMDDKLHLFRNLCPIKLLSGTF